MARRGTIDAVSDSPQTPPSSPAGVFAERRSRLAQRLEQCGVTCFALAGGWARPRNFAHSVYPFRAESHFLYLVGHHIEGGLLVFSEGQFGLCLPEPNDEAIVWDGPVPTAAQWQEDLGLEVHGYEWASGLSHAAVLPPQDEETAGWLSDLLGRSVLAQSGPDLVELDAALADEMIDLRTIKDDAAVDQLRFAARATARAHVAGMIASRAAGLESEVRGAMEGCLTAWGLSPGYTSIVTTNGEILHASRSAGRLQAGDLMLCDVGGETPEGFTADITRTWPVSGTFSPTQRELYELVLEVQTSAISSALVGTRYSDLHLSAVRRTGQLLIETGILRGSLDELVEKGAVSVFFPHGLGHLLGVDVHDMEDLGDRAGYESGKARSTHPALAALRLDRVLRAGMCVTIEPGFYQIPVLLQRARSDPELSPLIDWDCLARFGDVRGIRIEDDILVTDDEPEVLSEDAPKKVRDIEAVLAGASL